MGIIFKFALKNIKEKKFRTFLILFSVMMSAALFFASSAMSGSVEKMVVERIRKAFGSAEISIYANEKSPSQYFGMEPAKRLSSEMEYAVGVFEGSGTYKKSKSEYIRINLHGYEFSDLQRMNPVTLLEKAQGESFGGKNIILNKPTAERFGMKNGDIIELEVNGQKQKFRLYAIAAATGIFTEDGQSTHAIVPRDTITGLYGVKGQVSTIYVLPKDLSQKQVLIDKLAKAYNRYDVKEAIPLADIKQQSSSFTVPFMMMVVMVVAISVFIIYTSFKVITTEMLPIVGTFRSIGAEKATTDFVLMAQSFFYGVIGGGLGCGLGVGLLYLMSGMLLTESDRAAGFAVNINYSPGQLIGAFLLALFLSMGSSALPIIKVSKISVKDIVLNKIETKKKDKRWKIVVGILCVAFVLLVPPILPRSLAVGIDMLCMILAIIAIILLIPVITKIAIKLFEKLYEKFFGNEGLLAAKNLRENKSVLNNISLLAMGISALLLINTISFSVFKEVANAYRAFKYDIQVGVPQADKNVVSKLSRVDGVLDVYASYSYYNMEVDGTTDRIMMLVGADSRKFDDFYDLGIEGDRLALLAQLDEGRNIILSNALKYKFNLGMGDFIKLKCKTGVRSYKIIGFCSTMMYNGQTAIISDANLKSDMQLRYYGDIVVKCTKSPDQAEAAIKEKFRDNGLFTITLQRMINMNNEANASLFGIFKIFSIMTMVIGVFGILNNFSISFMERKRSLAMMRAVGIGKGQIIKMILAEAVTGGAIGGAVGILTGLLMIAIIPHLLKAIDLPVPIHNSPTLLLNALLGGILVTLVASISPALKSSKLNIIEAIKYE